jgi:hypothetical protein
MRIILAGTPPADDLDNFAMDRQRAPKSAHGFGRISAGVMQ